MTSLHANYPVNLLVGRPACPERKGKHPIKSLHVIFNMSILPIRSWPACLEKNKKTQTKNDQSTRNGAHIFSANQSNWLGFLANW